MDHTKKYMVIDGHLVTLSFANEPNRDLLARIKSILLPPGSNSQICRERLMEDIIGQIKEDAE